MKTALGVIIAIVSLGADARAQSRSNFDVRQVNQWVLDLQSEDPVARDVAARKLIETGPRALPLLNTLRQQALAPASRLAFARVHSGIVGLNAADTDLVLARLNAALNAEGSRPLDETARWVEEQGGAVLDYVVRELEAHKGNRRAETIRRRLMTLSAVRDLTRGDNLGDRAVKQLAELGPSALHDLAVLAADASMDSACRTVATERLVALGGGAALDAALTAAAGGHPPSLELLLPYLCTHTDAAHFAPSARVLIPALENNAGFAGHLTTLADQLDLSTIQKNLNAGDVPTRCLAARLVGLRRDEESRSDLRKELKHDDARVVRDAAIALGRIGNEKDLGALADLLSNNHVAIRRAAVQALSCLDGDRAVAWCATALRDRDIAVRAAAVRDLGRRRDEALVPALIVCLDDQDHSVVAEASNSLRSITGNREHVVEGGPSLREQWRKWWERRRSKAAASAAETEEKNAQEDSAVALAAEGHRILETLQLTLSSQFRPYGVLKGKDLVTPQKLSRAATVRMREVLDRVEDPERPELLTVEMDDDDKELVAHFLQHGRFHDAADIAECLGALPLTLSARDYILLVYEAAEGMVQSLGDRFTRLSMIEDASGKVDPDTLPSMFGKGATNGLMVEKGDEGVRVEFVLSGSSAERAGLRHGDALISMNGKLATGLDELQLPKKANEEVDLSVLRDGWSRPVLFHLTPQTPDPDKLVQSATLPGNIGYVRLQEFGLGCSQQLEWTLRELENAGIQGLVFDLRGNPGGTVVDAVAIVDKFVPKGHTITTMWTNSSKEGEDHEEQREESSDSETDRDYPVAVLINKNSASASEMTSGALQDLDRVVVVGRTSWGKGIGQSGAGIAGFPRESVFGTNRTSLSLGITILEYFLPSGRSIQGIGVEPDVPVAALSLLGERFEMMQRVRQHPKTAELVSRMVEEDPDHALGLARFDGWDPDEYDGFEAYRSELRVQLADELVRRALRAELRAALTADHPEIAIVDVQEDEDVRAAVAALAESLELSLEDHPEYEDLAD